MTEFNYIPDLKGLKIIKTKEEQFDKFFYKGHPNFLIPDFSKNCPLQDIWTGFLEYIENVIGHTIDDQDGGEVTFKEIKSEDGLTYCEYEAYGILIDEDSESKDIKIGIEGYVVEDDNDAHFIATKVNIPKWN